MRLLKRLFAVALGVAISLSGSITAYASALPPVKPNPLDGITFRHGDISWLPILAEKAGWPKQTWRKLGQIILRESGGCPNRKGGDIVDDNCNVIGVSEWSHRSDSGLLQINGVHWQPKHEYYAGLVCKQMKVCTQGPLLDALTNLKAGKLLWDVAGFTPWQVQG